MSFFDKLKGGTGTEKSSPNKTAKDNKNKEKPKKSKPKKKVEKIEIETPKKEAKPLRIEPKEEELVAEGELAIDVYETNGDIVVQSTIGGIKAEDLDISIENDMVTIRGSRESKMEQEGKKYFYQECYWGSFTRKVILPEEVDGNRAKATMKDGVLTLTMPKLQRKKKRKITVQQQE